MPLYNIDPSLTSSWKALDAHAAEMSSFDLKSEFIENPSRAKAFSLEWDGMFLDYSKNWINDKTKDLLLGLLDEVKLKEAIEAQFSGEIINRTEGRAVLHTALRTDSKDPILVDDKNILPEIEAVKAKMKSFSNNVISGQATGYTGKAFTDVVNIGIGGSDLGPAMVVDALGFYRNHLNVHFISNVDGDHVFQTLKDLNPETTLFVVVSKTFTTQETLTNATTSRQWFLKSAPVAAVSKHFVAVSTNIEKVTSFGIESDNIFPMNDWVGGRFSLWSAVGLSIALAVGYDHFQSLIEGAGAMDKHFRTTSFDNNMPVIMACLSTWYINFHDVQTEGVIPYSQYLNQFATYLQQAIMESNGKYVDRNGNEVTYRTSSVVWGEPGTNSQHAFFQLLHQGTTLIPCDFIGFKESLYQNQEHQDKLMANFFAQTEALMVGKTKEQDLGHKTGIEDSRDTTTPFKVFEGNRPTNTLLIDRLSPRSLGQLIALYEHKIFVQGVIWNIYSYDQFGVELGKQLASSVLSDFENLKASVHDTSTLQLMKRYKG
jgi:glucose-6-phosphate isomerase